MNAPIPNQYDPANARQLAGYAAGAYSAAAQSDAQGIWAATTDTHVVITSTPDDIIVAFRGTADMRNWFTDLDARLVQEVGWRLHAGFKTAFDSVEEKLIQALPDDAFLDKTKCKRRLWFTGHSLGGALAMIAADYLEPSFNVAGVYTYGQPRAGDAAWREHYDRNLKDRTFRVVNAVDLVPHVPWLCGRFRHAGHEVFYEDASLPVLDRPLSLYALDDIFAMVSEFLNPTSAEQWLADHHVNRYLKLFPVELPAQA